MKHQHELGEVLSTLFVAQHNSDQTEGKGHMVDNGAFLTVEDAYERTKGAAVMGCGDGNIVKRVYYRCTTCPEIYRVDTTIYNGDNYFKKNIAGSGRYADIMPDGWHKDYSPITNDPEYQEYLRLKKKFGDN